MIPMALAAPVGVARAQQSMRPECIRALNTPSRDSVAMWLTIETHAFDRRDDLSEPLQAAIADGVHMFLRIPQPLAFDTYAPTDRGSLRAQLSLFAVYRAMLVRDGSIRLASPLTGAGNGPIDRAMLDALRMLDSSRVLEPLATSLPNDETLVVLRMRLSPAASANAKPGDPIPLAGVKVPLRTITQELSQLRGYGNLHYPDDLRSLGITGQVDLTFVIGDDGVYEDGTAMADRVDHIDFLRASLTALPLMRFRPLEVEGCPVRTLVQQPFAFALVSGPRKPGP
jgi:hypothetical protein